MKLPRSQLGSILLITISLTACEKNHPIEQPNPTQHSKLSSLPGPDAISQRCQKCHQDIHHHWRKSDHGQANRLLNLALDTPAFSGQSLTTPSETWTFSQDSGKLTITTGGEKHTAAMVIGTKPLVQYLITASGGRWQTPSAAWDPSNKEWFDVFSGDIRTKQDWGHWTGRGMTWNTQCAWCHMTSYRKNYDHKTDTYNSHWKEMGVGCTQCHGNIAAKPDQKSGCLIDIKKHRHLTKNHPELIYDNCATCHSRRAEFDDHFHLGAKYGDHYQLQLPTLPHLYYPDGQIRDEDYTWTSLHISNMGHKGVRCLDCHDPHTTRLKLPLAGNALCMSCHSSGTNGRISGASIIDPAAHSHHFGVGKHNDVGSGHSCVDCHMTETTYMGRDPRRDHGFHVPDPQLTKEHGTPNACNKCHTDKDTDWAIHWTKTWYGNKMHTPERKRQRARTRAIADAYNGNPDSIAKLLAAHAAETNPYWQATIIQVLLPYATDPRVRNLGRQNVHSKDSIVRASACMLLEFTPGNGPWLEPMLKDPVKEVRIAASWAYRTSLSRNSSALEELNHTASFSADQPAGMMRLARLAIEANNLTQAEQWMKKAVQLDQTSPTTHEHYALLLGRLQRPRDALTHLQTAASLTPDNPRYPYLLALTHAELGQQDKTEQLLQKTLTLDPHHHRARYNLGLLLASQNKLTAAIASIRKAESTNPQSPDYPYARATLHLRLGQKQQALDACRMALSINRNHHPSINLLRQISDPHNP